MIPLLLATSVKNTYSSNIHQLYICKIVIQHTGIYYVGQFPLPSKTHETKKTYTFILILYTFPQTLTQLAFALQLAKSTESCSYLRRCFSWYLLTPHCPRQNERIFWPSGKSGNITISGYEILTNKILDQLFVKRKKWFCFSISKWAVLTLMLSSKTHSMVGSSMGLIGSFWEFYLLLWSIFRVQASEIAEPTKSLTHAGMNLTPRVETQHFSLWLIVHGKINIHQPGLPEKVRGTRWWFQPIYIVNLDHFSRDRGENSKPLKQPPPIGKDYLTKPMSRLLNYWIADSVDSGRWFTNLIFRFHNMMSWRKNTKGWLANTKQQNRYSIRSAQNTKTKANTNKTNIQTKQLCLKQKRKKGYLLTHFSHNIGTSLQGATGNFRSASLSWNQLRISLKDLGGETSRLYTNGQFQLQITSWHYKTMVVWLEILIISTRVGFGFNKQYHFNNQKVPKLRGKTWRLHSMYNHTPWTYIYIYIYTVHMYILLYRRTNS